MLRLESVESYLLQRLSDFLTSNSKSRNAMSKGISNGASTCLPEALPIFPEIGCSLSLYLFFSLFSFYILSLFAILQR